MDSRPDDSASGPDQTITPGAGVDGAGVEEGAAGLGAGLGGGPEKLTPGLRRRRDHWVWVGGPVPPGSDAITIWSLISVRSAAAATPHLLRHEEEHVRQWRSLGPAGFLRAYLGSYLRWRWRGFGHRAAYRLIPLEVEAERAADDGR